MWGFFLVVVASLLVCVGLYKFIEPMIPGFLRDLVHSAIFLLIVFPVGYYLFKWATSDFKAVVLLIGTVYFFGLCFENYWISLGTGTPFLPKPGINDGANIINFFKGMTGFSFWLALSLSLLLQALEAKGLRVTGWFGQGQKEKVKGETLGVMWGLLIVICWGIDGAMAWKQFPLMEGGMTGFVVNLFYLLASVFACELLYNVLQDELKRS